MTHLPSSLTLVARSTVYQKDGHLIQATLDALADSQKSVVATSASRDQAQYRPTHNAAAHRLVPHRMVLSRAACVIGTATMGLTQKYRSAATNGNWPPASRPVALGAAASRTA